MLFLLKQALSYSSETVPHRNSFERFVYKTIIFLVLELIDSEFPVFDIFDTSQLSRF